MYLPIALRVCVQIHRWNAKKQQMYLPIKFSLGNFYWQVHICHFYWEVSTDKYLPIDTPKYFLSSFVLKYFSLHQCAIFIVYISKKLAKLANVLQQITHYNFLVLEEIIEMIIPLLSRHLWNMKYRYRLVCLNFLILTECHKDQDWVID